VDAESAGLGHGATFTVRLPLPAVRMAIAPGDAGRFSRARVPAIPLPRLDGVRVLVLDDQPDAREAIAAVLEGCGAQVTAVASVRAALETLARRATDVVVSDIAMPVEDGYRFIDQTRSLPHDAGGDVPVVALTARGGTPEEIRILEAGFDAYLSKPIEPTELAASVARLARRGTPT
jgi:CheY-like chemotaxis protein